MLSTALTLLALGGGTAQRLPDQLDVLRGVDRTPQVKLLIDLSGSMLDPGTGSVDCTHYNAIRGYPSGTILSRIEQLAAVLTGCITSSDGLIDRWASQIVFGVDGYEGGNFGLTPVDTPEFVGFPAGPPAFSSDLTALETQILGLPATVNPFSGTAMAAGYRNTALRFAQHFTNSNTEQCRQNAILLMTDGNGNSGLAYDFTQVQGEPDLLQVRDAALWYVSTASRANGLTYGGPGQYRPPHLDQAATYLWGDGALPTDRHDALPNVDGVQPIRTYTIGFNAPDAAQALLRDMAGNGGGEFYDATTYSELANAFDRAIFQINSNADASFQGITIQGDGLFSGNFVYQNSYQGADRSGHWYGNIKKFCLIPGPGATDCLLENNPLGDGFVINDEPRDLFVGGTGYATREGGVGERMLRRMTSDARRPPQTVPASPYTNRNIVTWRHGGNQYIDVANATLTPSDTFTLNFCQHYSLLNKLYGYTFDTTSCLLASTAPVEFDTWPLADTVNGGQVLLKYSENCEDGPGDRCYLVTVSNLGMLHIYDADDGTETQAIVPPHFMFPNQSANNKLADIVKQPTTRFTRRFFFDGGISLFHEDDNGNGYIDGTEQAELIAGFGRGGPGYIKWNVNTVTNGVFTATDNPPEPLVRDLDSGFVHLRDTWAAPWTGIYELANGTRRPVAVFPSGHMPELDEPSEPFARITTTNTAPSGDTEASPFAANCVDVGIPAEVCSTPSVQDICTAAGAPAGFCGTGSTCSPCDDADPLVCAALGATPPFCYNWPGLSAYNGTDLSAYGITQVYPLRISVGPYTYNQGVTQGIAYKLTFSRLHLQPNDALIIYDEDGVEIERFPGALAAYPAGTQSSWIRSPSFQLRVVTNGVDDAEGYGYTISGVDIIRDVVPITPRNVYPSVYVVDIDAWNGDLNGFSTIPSSGVSRQSNGILARFTRSCQNTVIGSNEVCVDAGTAPDLLQMVCPISAEPAVYTEGGVLRAIYVNDECGQIWSITQERDRTGWTARRILSTNRKSGQEIVGPYESKDYRKMFAKPDIVISTCTGRRAIGVYFGTGNLQRPAAIVSPTRPAGVAQPNLQDGRVTRFGSLTSSHEADVLGVVWDVPGIPAGGFTLQDLTNVTAQLDVDPTGGTAQNGFFIELDEDEKMIRNPLVLDGVAFFQTYEPTIASTECDDASGQSFAYAFDNCTAAPVRANATSPSDRKTLLNPDSLIGGQTSVVVTDPKNGGETIVLGGDAAVGANADLRADLDQDRFGRGVRLFLWRVNVD